MSVPVRFRARKRNHNEPADAPEGRARGGAHLSAIMQQALAGRREDFPRIAWSAGPASGALEWPIIVERWRGGPDGRVERWSVLEVEQVLERVGELVTAREMRPAIGVAAERRQEALLDQRQHRGVVAGLMRDVMRFRERRHGDEWNAEAELVEAGAVLGKGTGRVGRESGTE